jgi:hypothetical protein
MVAKEICFVKKFLIFLLALSSVHFPELRKMSKKYLQRQQYQRQRLTEIPGQPGGTDAAQRPLQPFIKAFPLLIGTDSHRLRLRFPFRFNAAYRRKVFDAAAQRQSQRRIVSIPNGGSLHSLGILRFSVSCACAWIRETPTRIALAVSARSPAGKAFGDAIVHLRSEYARHPPVVTAAHCSPMLPSAFLACPLPLSAQPMHSVPFHTGRAIKEQQP